MYQAAEEAAATGPRGKKRTAADVEVSNAEKAVVDLSSPIVAAKALKNDAELAGMREAHLRDSVAICDFLHSIEQKVRTEIAIERFHLFLGWQCILCSSCCIFSNSIEHKVAYDIAIKHHAL